MRNHENNNCLEDFKSLGEQSGETLGEALADYANRGWKIFPCLPGAKQPATPNGYKDASSDPAVINRWWSESPDYNLAMCPEDAGLCVIDVDSAKNDFDQAAFEALNLPPTYTVQTPSGGWHYYFKGSLPTTAGNLGTGIDTRGRGGYVLLPPSTVEGRRYSVIGDRTPIALPAEIAARLARRNEALAASADIELDQATNVVRATTRLRDLTSRHDVAVSGQGGNARAYQLACELRDFGLSPEKSIELVMEPDGWNDHCIPPWSEDELTGVFANASRYGQNSTGVYATEPASRLFADLISQADALSEANGAETSDDGLLYDFADILERPTKPVEELIPGLVEKGIATMLSGPGGVHKSRVAMQLGLSLQAGVPVFGRPVEHATFVYLSYEDEIDEVARRAQAIKRQLSLPSLPTGKYFDFTASTSPAVTISDEGIRLEQRFHKLRDYLLSIPGHKFVVIDSTYNFLHFVGQTKINETAVKSALSLLDQLCRMTNSTILYLWHPSQAGQERGDATGWSVAWNNTPRARLSLNEAKDSRKKPIPGMYMLKVEKRNHGPKGEPVYLAWQDGILAPVETVTSLYHACCEVAKLAAKHHKPIRKTGDMEGWIIDDINAACGARPSPRQVRAELDKAVTLHQLRYISGHGDIKAGYYPFAADPQTGRVYPDYSIPNPYLDPENETEEWDLPINSQIH